MDLSELCGLDVDDFDGIEDPSSGDEVQEESQAVLKALRLRDEDKERREVERRKNKTKR